jgi:ABC-2 type transport system ATP-binding protein
MSILLKVSHLYKYYDNFLALNDVSFTIPTSTIVSVVGSNGNGKTTLFNCISGVSQYNSGVITLDGLDYSKDLLKAKSNIAYCLDESSAYEMMSGKEYLEFIYDIYLSFNKDLPVDYFIKRYCKLVRDFNMEEHMNKLIKYYSHGTKQKIEIMANLIHPFKLWILDEPFLGLDPEAIDILITYFKEEVDRGASIIFSVHNIEQALTISNELLLINKSSLVKDYKDLSNKDLISHEIHSIMENK